jgi:outer membrane protein OmpA-like peptidoglycan-associated protein
MADGSGTGALFDGGSADNGEISSVVGLLMRLEDLKSQGLSPDQVAAAMDDGGFEVPGGGSWDAAAVDRIAGVVESVRSGPAPSSAPLAPRASASTPALRAPAPVGVSGNLAANRDHTGRFDRDFGSGAGWTPRDEHQAGQGRFDEDNYEDDDHDSVAAERERSRRTAMVLGALGLTTAGFLAFAALRSPDGDVADPTTDETLASASVESGSTDAGSDGSTSTDPQGTDSSLPDGLAPPPLDDADPADMMSIRVEPEPLDGDGTAAAGSVPAATATVKADGLLHLEGAFPSQEEADRYIAGVGKVFGDENIVEAYVINAAAPLPSVSDVALDKPVLFETGTATIDPSYHAFLEACGDVLRLNPQITMSIAAFTDSTGPDELNLELSQQRAQAIYDFYRDLDIDDSQLLSFGYGEADPVGDNATEAGREQNRRAMLQLLNVMAEESQDSEG